MKKGNLQQAEKEWINSLKRGQEKEILKEQIVQILANLSWLRVMCLLSWGLPAGIRRRWKLGCFLTGLNAEILVFLFFYFVLLRTLFPCICYLCLTSAKVRKEHLSQQETVMRKPLQQRQPHEEITLRHFWTGIEINKAAEQLLLSIKETLGGNKWSPWVRRAHFKAGLYREISPANFSARELFWGFLFV